MDRPPPIDYRAALIDVVAVAQSARSATLGWRAICVRERRRVGAKWIEPLTTLDLDEDAAKLSRGVHQVARRASRQVDTLVFGLFDGIDDGSGAYAGYHVAAIATKGRAANDFMRDPWSAERHFLRSDVLDTIVKAAGRAPSDVRPLLEYSLCFGAAALTSRFAAGGLSHRVVVAFDDDYGRALPNDAPRFAELVPVQPVAEDVTDLQMAMRLLTRV
ncbi:hypothetical protein LVJ94_14050 [Pendulispora rubella]|uniref:Uncharacterized protein n=1 Tax=Pendulispora rubella TaxID=2741070 RepID=A0ABZ2LGT5_9BACT